MVPRAVATAIARELQGLAELRDWEPVAERVEGVLDALRGGEGLTDRDVATIHEWVARWTALAPPVRRFYATTAPTDRAVGAALIWILTRRDRSPAPAHLRQAVRIASEREGIGSGLDLLPPLPSS